MNGSSASLCGGVLQTAVLLLCGGVVCAADPQVSQEVALIEGAPTLIDQGLVFTDQYGRTDVLSEDQEDQEDQEDAPVPARDGCRGDPLAGSRWFDRAQEYFSRRTCVPAVWFDRFFGADRGEEIASTLLRITPSLQYSDRDITTLGVQVKARVRLPNLQHRLHLVVNDDPVEKKDLLPGEVDRPVQANASGQGGSAALRYLLALNKTARLDVDVGLRSQLKFFSRIRYTQGWVHSPVLQTRYTQSFYFKDGDGFGETSLLEVERMLAEDLLLRWSTQATLKEAVNGLELREGIQLLRQLDRDRAVSGNIAATIGEEPRWQANSYMASVRYRQRIFRPWFFYEVEPFVDWIREDHFKTNPGIAFRLEVVLGSVRATPEAVSPVVAPEIVPNEESRPGSALPDSVEPLTNSMDGAQTDAP